MKKILALVLVFLLVLPGVLAVGAGQQSVGQDNSRSQQANQGTGSEIEQSEIECETAEDCAVYLCDCKCHEVGYEGPVCGIMGSDYCLDNAGISGCVCEGGECIEVEVETEDSETEAPKPQIREIRQVKAKTSTQLKEMVQEREQEMEQEEQNLSQKEQKVYKNQNQVRLAVHALLAMENLTGGIGPQISAIAREFNNSVKATILAEEKIQKRSKLVRFFVGGDTEAAEEIEQAVVLNREKIQELKQLRTQCVECDEETRAIMSEQVQNMEQEQERLQQLSQNEKQRRGIFARLFGRRN